MSFIKLWDRKKRLLSGLDLRNDCCGCLRINKLQKACIGEKSFKSPNPEKFSNRDQNKENNICKKQNNKKSSTDIAGFRAQNIMVLLFSFSHFLRVYKPGQQFYVGELKSPT